MKDVFLRYIAFCLARSTTVNGWSAIPVQDPAERDEAVEVIHRRRMFVSPVPIRICRTCLYSPFGTLWGLPPLNGEYKQFALYPRCLTFYVVESLPHVYFEVYYGTWR